MLILLILSWIIATIMFFLDKENYMMWLVIMWVTAIGIRYEVIRKK